MALTATSVIDHVRTLLGDPHGDYHSDEKMLLHLNASLEDICDKSRSLCVLSQRALIKDQATYGLPEPFLQEHVVGIIYKGRWCRLHYANIGATLPDIHDDYRLSTRPYKYTIWGQSSEEKYVHTVVVSDNPQADNSGEVSFVSPEPVPAAKVGDRIINITDDSTGFIAMIAGENPGSRITFSNLSGGKTNRMNVGDLYRILSPDESLKSLFISPPPDKTDDQGVESLYIYYAKSHKRITQIDIDAGNDRLEIDQEFAKTLRLCMLYYAHQDEKGIDHPATQIAESRYETEYYRAKIPVMRRIRQFISSWRPGVMRNRPIRGTEVVTRGADWDLRPF